MRIPRARAYACMQLHLLILRIYKYTRIHSISMRMRISRYKSTKFWIVSSDSDPSLLPDLSYHAAVIVIINLGSKVGRPPLRIIHAVNRKRISSTLSLLSAALSPPIVASVNSCFFRCSAMIFSSMEFRTMRRVTVMARCCPEEWVCARGGTKWDEN